MGIFSRRETIEYDHPVPNQPSLWERFDAAERERRIDEFIAADREELLEEWRAFPSISQRRKSCQRCGQGIRRHKVSTATRCCSTYEIVVREKDGEVVLAKAWHWQPLFFEGRRELIRVFRHDFPAYLVVTCECGNVVGSYRPLNPEDQQPKGAVL